MTDVVKKAKRQRNIRKTLLTSALIATITAPRWAESEVSINCAGLRAIIESDKLIAPSKLTPHSHKFTLAKKRSISDAQRIQLARIHLTYC